MQALAEFIMRRQFNAVCIAFVFAMLPLFEWLSAAAVALVTLHLGWRQGLIILAWAGLSGVVRWSMGDMLTLPMLLMTFLAAAVLRQYVSLLYAIVTVSVLSAVVMILFQKIMPPGLEELIDKTAKMLTDMQFFDQLEIADPTQWIHEFALTSFGFSVAIAALVSLLIGRWWQAKLYNPGGFQEEFHQLRLTPLVIGLLTGTAVVTVGLVPQLSFIGVLLSLPIFLAGIALVHSVARIYNLGSQILIPFYVLLVFLNGYMYLLLMLLVMADSFMNIRQRLAAKSDQ